MMISYLIRSIKLIYYIKKSWLFATVFFRIVNGLLPFAELWVLQTLINEIALFVKGDNSSMLLIIKLIILQLVFAIIKSGITNFLNVLDTSMEQLLHYELGKMIMNKLISVPYSCFELPSFYNHQFRIKNNYGTKFLRPIKNILESLQNVISILSFISFLFFAHWILVIMAVVVGIPTFIIQYKYGQAKFNLLIGQTTELREASYIHGLLSNKQSAKEVRLFNLGNTFLEKWSKIILTNNSRLIHILKKQRNMNIGLDGLSAILYALATMVTVKIINLKKLSIGNFVTIIQAMKELQQRINHISLLLAVILESSLYVKDFFDFMDFENSETENNTNMIGKTVKITNVKNIRIRNLFYKYPINQEYTLKNISLEIKENEKIAIVGDNGSGKSTLIKILVGLYQPTKGDILFGENEIRQIEKTSLRENITVIFQDFVKFSYSVKENIAFSNISDINNDIKINSVVNEMEINNLIKKLPNGINTNLGKIHPDSVDISGGEWQKIALSRALFKGSNIIVLDEPTAALDPKTEIYIFEKFIDLVKDKTAIFISHRMASARIADRIIVMNKGEIAEIGNHEDLINKKGVYYNMYNSQAVWYQ
ncbi:hypothetical protein DCE79_13660 [Lysinibacillus sp. 2017]|nr:hypothetical protein DCE79_13660 [Lysinibacillus sp. 2017]TGN35768.1 ABC transporter ATP-binding protein [Lysinibacillus sp. S2017]